MYQNNQFRNNKNMKKGQNMQNYSNFKPANYNNFNSNLYKINDPQYMANTNLSDNYQNQFGRNAFFQNFQKGYSKSFEYEYFATSADLQKDISEYYNEINNILPEEKKLNNVNNYQSK